ncbi:helix-turn-helix domain-containing protein [Microbacterium sp. NPDC077663]|uniref:helix-turn-helix domain-containing protein n=1 Tax=Microbacterium sp. NPDC077663 TaxID=3364189 RepID=UPI0037CC2D00
MGGSSDTGAARVDELISELRMLRDARGVSYRELAARVTEQRIDAGANPAAARVPHTTISDAFRLGRRRLNAGLVAEIVEALGEDPAAVALWRARVAAAVAAGSSAAPEPRLETPTPEQPVPASDGLSWGRLVALIVAGVLLNSTGKFVNPLLGDVFFFDMVGTALVAILGGPWAAAAVGVVFIVVELLKGQVVAAVFSVTMVSAGLVWGFGATRFRLAATLPRFLALSAFVAVVTSSIAVPITVFYLGGSTDRGLDGLRDLVIGMTGVHTEVAISIVNATISLIDKVIVGAIAYGVAVLVRRALRPAPRLGA